MSMKKKISKIFNKPAKAKKEMAKDKEVELGYQLELSEDKQEEIIALIRDMVEDYNDSRAGYMGRRARYINQYEGIKPPKTTPWPGCSNLSTMVTTVSVDTLHSKLFNMAWNEKTLYWEGVEEHDIESAEINKDMMNWVVSTDMNLQDTMDDLTHCLLIDGTIAYKKIWKPYWTYVTRKIPKEITSTTLLTGKLEYDIKYDYIRRERAFMERRPLENIYFPYDANSSEYRWEDKTNIIDERWFTLPQLRALQMQGCIDKRVNIDDLKAKMMNTQEYTDTEKARMDAEGTTPENKITDYDKIKLYEAEIMYDITGDGRLEKCVFLICPEPGMYLSGKALHCVSRIARSSYVIRPFIRRPGRAYGKSIPELVYHLHNEMDAIHNQRIDAGNMVISPFFFYRAASGTNPRRIVAGPATGIPLDDPERDVRFPTFPAQGLSISFQEERLVLEQIERLTYLTPAMLGKETSQRPTARGTLAVIQQGEQKFSLLGRRVQNIFCAVLTDIRQMYEENMPPETWERIMGDKLRDFPSPEVIAGMYDARMQLDMSAGDPSQERELAVMLFQTMAMDPLVMQNPAYMWEVRAEYLRALRREPVEKYIGPRPPQAEQGTDDANDLIMKIEGEMANIQVDDLQPEIILPELYKFKRTPRYINLTPEAKALLETVIRELKMLYISRMNQGVQNAQQGNPNGTGQAQGGITGSPFQQSMGSTGAGTTQGEPVPPGAVGGTPPVGPTQ